MSRILTPQSPLLTSNTKRQKTKRRRKTKGPKTIEQKLSQKVERSPQAVEKIIEDVLLSDDQIAGGMTQALDDMLGYDTEYAAYLLERDKEERQRLEAIAKIQRAETPVQRQQRLMREERMAARKRVRNELYRDDRSPLQKARDAINAINIKKICKTLDHMGLLIKPWQGCTLLCMFVVMLMTNIAVSGNSDVIQVAPDSYQTFCTNCSNKYQTKRSQFEEFSFYQVHPDGFELQYGKKHPDYPACPKCNIIHQKLILVARPDRDDRFLLATHYRFQMPTDAKELQKLSDKYR